MPKSLTGRKRKAQIRQAVQNYRSFDENREQEKSRDRLNHQERRSNPEVRKAEQASDTAHRKAKRTVPEVREAEQLENTLQHRQRRSDPDSRVAEQEVNTSQRRQKRLDPEVREAEQTSDTLRRKKSRLDPDVRQHEQAGNTSQHIIRRSNIELKQLQQKVNTQQKKAKRSKLIPWTEAVKLYEEKIRDGPMHNCYSCDRLFFKNQLVFTTRQKMLDKNCMEEYIDKLVLEEFHTESTYQFCTTCNNSISKKLFPRFNINNSQLKFPDIPESVKVLTDLESQCVALRIPFMKLYPLGCDRQWGIKSGVVNVPIDVRKTLETIPAHPNMSGLIELTLMRSMKYKKYYKKATVRPDVIFKAAVELERTPLYQKENVKLMDENEWLQSVADENSTDLRDCDTEPVLREETATSDSGERDHDEFIPEETMLDVASGVMFAPGEGQIPLPILMDTHCEELSFPRIWAGHERTCSPNVKLSFEDHVSSEIRRRDRRAVEPPHILFLYRKSQIKQLKSQMQIVFRKSGQGMGITAQQALNKDFVNEVVAKDNAYRFMSSITGSPSYWEKQKKNVLGMIRQLGIFQLFITLSAAETHWEELIRILKKVVDNEELVDFKQMTFEEKARLIRSDPVTCALYFDHRLKELMHTWKAADGPFGNFKMVNFFYRIEFQHRGSPHVHMIVYLQGVPTYDSNSQDGNKHLITFIDSVITTNTDDTELEELKKYQYHKCKDTCKRVVRGVTTCRFDAPFFPMRETRILEPIPDEANLSSERKKFLTKLRERIKDTISIDNPEVNTFDDLLEKVQCTEDDYLMAIRIKLKQKKVFLKRSPKDARINGFNKKILTLMRSNMDIQYVTDAYACIGYVVDYINKSNRGLSRLMRQCIDDCNKGNVGLREKLKGLAHILFNCSEISAQEAAWCRLRLDMSKSSIKIEFINTSPRKTRQKMLKDDGELQKLDPNSTDIMKKGPLDRYSERPVELENYCLADFFANFTLDSRTKNIPDDFENQADQGIDEEFLDSAIARKILRKFKLPDGKIISERRQPKVIRYCRFNKHEDPDNYYREMLMLFYPWRDEEKEVENQNYVELFKNEVITSVINANYRKYNSADIDAIDLNELYKEYEVREGDQEETGESIENDENSANNFLNVFDYDDTIIQPNIMMEIGEEAPGVDTVKRYVVPDLMQEDDYLKLVDSLNVKQRDFLMHVISCFKNKELPIYYFLSGGAGVGKSCLIKAIYQSVVRLFRKDPGPVESCEVLLTSYTGKAAHNIGGMTTHSAFSLNANEGQSRVTNLSPDTLNTLTAKLSNLKLIIIDEISMLTSDLLFQISNNLNQVFRTLNPQSPTYFGGVSVIVVGDFNQLQPIGRYVFESRSNQLASVAGNPIWQKFQLFELDEIMRQKNDLLFAQALSRLAIGEMTEEDVKMFTSRTYTESNVPDEAKKCIRLFDTNDEVDGYNRIRAHEIQAADPNLMKIEFKADDKLLGNLTKTQENRARHSLELLKPKNTQGLVRNLILLESMRYMIPVNINVSDGLFNGASGVLRKLEIVSGRCEAVYLEFDDPKVGVIARSARSEIMRANKIPSNWTPITPCRKTFNINQGGTVQVCRTQFPLVQAEGITIHKSQGQSMTQVAVYTGNKKMKRKSLYVACSRSTSLQGLHIIGTFKPPPPISTTDKAFTEMNRLREQCTLTPKFELLRQPAEGTIQIISFNIQSLRKHVKTVNSDQVFTKSNVLALQETWLKRGENHAIADMKEVARNSYETSVAKGTILYGRKNDFFHDAVQYQFLSESKHIDITSCIYEDIRIINIYKNPKAPEGMLKEIICRIEHLFTHENVVLCGDFNMNFFKTNSFEKLLKEKYDMHLVSPRESTTDNNTMIDVVFAKLLTYSINSHIYESYFSHHKPIVIRLNKK